MSFAGQYLSVLNVPEKNIIQEYKRIIASLFTARAISYRQHMGIPFEDAAMSVACLEMVPASVSGVMYSSHPFNVHENNIIIQAVWGLGPYVVDGIITPDSYTLSKTRSASNSGNEDILQIRQIGLRKGGLSCRGGCR